MSYTYPDRGLVRNLIFETSYNRYTYPDRQTWLNAKYSPRNGEYKISGTEAPVACDHSPWVTQAELYDYKLGLKRRKDISNNPNVLYGIYSEPFIRSQFMIDLPYFRLDYHEFDILESTLYPWMTCTLDGELTVIRENPWGLPIGANGILEIKTGSFRTESDIHGWYEQIGIPVYYYEQMIHCMTVMGSQFAINPVRLHRDPWKDEDQGFPEIRTFYRFVDRRSEDVQYDIQALISNEKDFLEVLKKKERPAVTLRMEA